MLINFKILKGIITFNFRKIFEVQEEWLRTTKFPGRELQEEYDPESWFRKHTILELGKFSICLWLAPKSWTREVYPKQESGVVWTDPKY